MPIILVTGDLGMVGSAICKLFKDNKYKDLELRASAKEDYDLTKEQSVRTLYELMRPDYVIHCAAVVGGVKFNKEHPDKLFRDNILMNTHVIHYAHHYGVKKLIAFSSACAFDDKRNPFKEDDLQEGKPYEGNLAYGYAKRMVDIQIKTYNKVHNRKDLTVIPTSIYGPHDNFSLENGHFIASLIAKTHKAKKYNTELELWGNGSPLRELLFSEDLAQILIELLLKDTPDKIIIPGEEVSIAEAAYTITELMGFSGRIVWDRSKPNGQYRKPTDPTRFREFMKDFKFTPYREGLRKTIDWYCKHKQNNWYIRGER
jgi:GDP-L-fucose synthase